MTGRHKSSGEQTSASGASHFDSRSHASVRSPGHGHKEQPPHPKRILIVDGDLLSIVNISQTLLRSGYVLSHATDEAEAMKAVKTEKPDLIICALSSRKQDGRRFAEEMRHTRNIPSIPFLFVLESQSDSSRAPQILGPKQYLTKPFTREQLSLAVHEQLAQLAERSDG